MDIVRFKGGLGNQMFQYAFMEALREQGREVYSSLGFYRNHPNLRPFVLNQVFPHLDFNEVKDSVFQEIDERWRKVKEDANQVKRLENDLKNRFFYVENEDGRYDENVFETRNCTFVGYWQSEKYFKTIQEQIRKLFVFQHLEPQLYRFGEELKNNYVSIHIRRCDYLNFDIFQTISLEYYYHAINYMKTIFPDVRFVFFSDDKVWVRENFKLENMLICEPGLFFNYKDWYDMYLMTLCRGNIIANSSFSWWGAWLNKNKKSVVVAPRKWFNGCDTPDIWCEWWIKI